MISSAKREMSTAIIAVMNANSATTSRADVPSSEFSAGTIETELRGDELGVEAERGPGQRSPAVGRDGGTGRPVAEALEVAHERPGVRLQVVREQDRLRVLQVRAPGHDRVRVGFGLSDEGIDDAEDVARDRARVVEQVHPHQRGDLIVAAATGTQLAAELGTRLAR